MLGIGTLLRLAGLPAAPKAIGACAVCRGPVEGSEPYICLRGLLVHRGCATYRMRREGGGYPGTERLGRQAATGPP